MLSLKNYIVTTPLDVRLRSSLAKRHNSTQYIHDEEKQAASQPARHKKNYDEVCVCKRS